KIDNEEGKELNIKLNWNIGTDIERIDENKFRLIIDDKNSLTLELSSITKGNIQIYCGDENKPAGWRSLYYGEKVPVNQLVYEVESLEKEEIIVTLISLDKL